MTPGAKSEPEVGHDPSVENHWSQQMPYHQNVVAFWSLAPSPLVCDKWCKWNVFLCFSTNLSARVYASMTLVRNSRLRDKSVNIRLFCENVTANSFGKMFISLKKSVILNQLCPTHLPHLENFRPFTCGKVQLLCFFKLGFLWFCFEPCHLKISSNLFSLSKKQVYNLVISNLVSYPIYLRSCS